jgi:hypothetical protein
MCSQPIPFLLLPCSVACGLQLTYGLSADAVQGLRTGAPLPGARHTAARILLFLDGFDELQGEEGGEEPTKDACLRLRNLYATVCGGGETEAWSPDVLRVVVTSRESRLNGRADERAVCGAHRRRVLLPFNRQQVGPLQWSCTVCKAERCCFVGWLGAFEKTSRCCVC